MSMTIVGLQSSQAEMACPEGHECFCTPLTGVWHVIPNEGGGGMSFNAGCTEEDNR